MTITFTLILISNQTFMSKWLFIGPWPTIAPLQSFLHLWHCHPRFSSYAVTSIIGKMPHCNSTMRWSWSRLATPKMESQNMSKRISYTMYPHSVIGSGFAFIFFPAGSKGIQSKALYVYTIWRRSGQIHKVSARVGFSEPGKWDGLFIKCCSSLWRDCTCAGLLQPTHSKLFCHALAAKNSRGHCMSCQSHATGLTRPSIRQWTQFCVLLSQKRFESREAAKVKRLQQRCCLCGYVQQLQFEFSGRHHDFTWQVCWRTVKQEDWQLGWERLECFCNTSKNDAHIGSTTPGGRLADDLQTSLR